MPVDNNITGIPAPAVSQSPWMDMAGLLRKSRSPLSVVSDMPVAAKFREAVKPVLDAPVNIDPAYIRIGLQRLEGTVSENQLETSVPAARKDTVSANEATAQEMAGKDKVAGWFQTAFAAVGPMPGLDAAGGSAGSGVLSGIGLFTAALDLTTRIVQEHGDAANVQVTPGGPGQTLDISIGGLVGMAVDKTIAGTCIVAARQDASGTYFDRNGNVIVPQPGGKPVITEQAASHWKDSVTVGITVAIAVGIGLAGAKGVGALGRAAGEEGNVVKAVATNWQGTSQGGTAFADVAGGRATAYPRVTGINSTELESETDRTRAEQAFWDVIFDDYGLEKNTVLEFMRQRVTLYGENANMVSKLTRGAAQCLAAPWNA